MDARGQMMLSPGDVLAGYEIENYIARGGMAVVYSARDLSLGRRVALKLIAPELATNDKFRQRFIRESELAASLDHPNVLPIYAAGEAEGILYIAMRYVDGQDLGRAIAEAGRLDPADALPMFTQVAAALDTAHAHGLIHRDVKPGNILIARMPGTSGENHVYLTDFGLTKRSTSLSGFTTAGHFIGTIAYVAPEQIAGREVTHAADVYAMGCVLYETLSGTPPFQRDDDAAMLWAHMSASPEPLAGFVPGVPEAVDVVIARAMAKDPAERTQSCRAVIAQLRQAFRTGVAPAVEYAAEEPLSIGQRRPPAGSLDDNINAGEPAFRDGQEDTGRELGHGVGQRAGQGAGNVGRHGPERVEDAAGSDAGHDARHGTDVGHRAESGVDDSAGYGAGHHTGQSIGREASSGQQAGPGLGHQARYSSDHQAGNGSGQGPRLGLEDEPGLDEPLVTPPSPGASMATVRPAPEIPASAGPNQPNEPTPPGTATGSTPRPRPRPGPRRAPWIIAAIAVLALLGAAFVVLPRWLEPDFVSYSGDDESTSWLAFDRPADWSLHPNLSKTCFCTNQYGAVLETGDWTNVIAAIKNDTTVEGLYAEQTPRLDLEDATAVSQHLDTFLAENKKELGAPVRTTVDDRSAWAVEGTLIASKDPTLKLSIRYLMVMSASGRNTDHIVLFTRDQDQDRLAERLDRVEQSIRFLENG